MPRYNVERWNLACQFCQFVYSMKYDIEDGLYDEVKDIVLLTREENKGCKISELPEASRDTFADDIIEIIEEYGY